MYLETLKHARAEFQTHDKQYIRRCAGFFEGSNMHISYKGWISIHVSMNMYITNL